MVLDGSLPAKCASCGALRAAICGHLEGSTLQRLSGITHFQQLERGQSLLWQSDAAPAVGIVQSGMLKLTMSLRDGREQTVGLALPGDFVGRPLATTSEHTVTAIAPSRVCVVSRTAFESLAHDAPDVEHALIQESFDQLDKARSWLLTLGRKSTSERVATLLLDLHHQAGSTDDSVPLPMTRQEIAELLGTTIETVSRHLAAFKRAGLIALPTLRSFRILALDRLRIVAG